MSKYLQLANILKAIEREKSKQLSYISKASSDLSTKAMQRLDDNARDCAIEIRRLEHEAHCLAVEIGIADVRSDAHYTPVRAAAGFGREFIIERRRPEVDA